MVALNGGRPAADEPQGGPGRLVAFRETVVSRATKFLLMKAREPWAHVLVGLAIARRQHRRGHRADPQRARSGHRPRAVEGAALAPGRRRLADPLIDDPRHTSTRTAPITYPTSRRARSWTSGCSASPPRPRRDRRRAQQAGRRDQGVSRHPRFARAQSSTSSGRADRHPRQLLPTPRRTEILDSDADMEDEDLIAREDMVVTVSHEGYIKRVPLSMYRAQRRGGKGRSGMSTKEEDFVTRCSSPTRIRRCCSSPPAGSSTS